MVSRTLNSLKLTLVPLQRRYLIICPGHPSPWWATPAGTLLISHSCPPYEPHLVYSLATVFKPKIHSHSLSFCMQDLPVVACLTSWPCAGFPWPSPQPSLVICLVFYRPSLHLTISAVTPWTANLPSAPDYPRQTDQPLVVLARTMTVLSPVSALWLCHFLIKSMLTWNPSSAGAKMVPVCTKDNQTKASNLLKVFSRAWTLWQ